MDAAGCIYVDIYNKRRGHDLAREQEGRGASWRRDEAEIAFTYKILKKVKIFKQKEHWLLFFLRNKQDGPLE